MDKQSYRPAKQKNKPTSTHKNPLHELIEQEIHDVICWSAIGSFVIPFRMFGKYKSEPNVLLFNPPRLEPSSKEEVLEFLTLSFTDFSAPNIPWIKKSRKSELDDVIGKAVFESYWKEAFNIIKSEIFISTGCNMSKSYRFVKARISVSTINQRATEGIEEFNRNIMLLQEKPTSKAIILYVDGGGFEKCPIDTLPNRHISKCEFYFAVDNCLLPNES